MSYINRTATCWRIKLSNDKILCLTDSDQDLIYKNEHYYCGSYFTPSNIISSNELGQDNFSIYGALDDKHFSKKALVAGDFSESYIEVFLIDLDEPDKERLLLKTGWFGAVKYNDHTFSVEIFSLGAKANNIIGKCYSASCRTQFGDKYCGMDLAQYSFAGQVTSIVDMNDFIDETREEPDNYFSQGLLIFVTGNNKGRKFNIRAYRGKKISLDSMLNLEINIGDRYQVTAGCDKSITTCIEKFNNAINFRGENLIPSKHKLVASNF